MSYSSTHHTTRAKVRIVGPAKKRAMYGLGSTLIINTRTGNDSTRAVQAVLQRLNFLSSGTGSSGADGKWGTRTAFALTLAAHYVGYSGTPYTVSGTTVTIPDDLMRLLQSAAPASPDQVQAAQAAAPPVTAVDATVTDTSTTPAPDSGSGGTVPVIAIGIGVIAVAALAAWAMSSTNIKIEEPTKYQTKYRTRRTYIPVAVHRNRRRSRR